MILEINLKSTNLQSDKQQQSIVVVFLNLWSHIIPRRRIQLALLLVVILASGIAELVSLGMVLPFLLVLSEPERLWGFANVKTLANAMGLVQASQLLLPATLGFVIAVVIASSIRILNLWMSGRISAAIGSDLSCEAYMRTLYQPYEIHLKSSSSVVISSVTTQIGKTVVSINALLQLLAAAVVAAALFIGLISVNASVAISSAIVLSIAYSILALTARRELSANGKRILFASSQLLKAVQEGLGAIRDVLLDGSQQVYLKIYSQADRPARQLNAKNVFIGAYPRYALESLGMVSIALIGYFIVQQKGSSVGVIPLLGTLALGAQRLLPALQQVYSGWSVLNAQKPAVIEVLSRLALPMPPSSESIEKISFSNSICLENVSFLYDNDPTYVLKCLSLRINKGESVGIIGETGSGKSTLIDLLMGLLIPTSGSIYIDGQDLHDPNHPHRLTSWRANIAHVPQAIFLSDCSIAENIAFGVPKDQIDMARLKKSAERAQIDGFIENSLRGYETIVGERGLRLSGGQRQRIGIARALYKQAQILVFDEATSALDSRTEEYVMKSIEEISTDHTMFIIAHRLSTIARCDRVIQLSGSGGVKIIDRAEIHSLIHNVNQSN